MTLFLQITDAALAEAAAAADAYEGKRPGHGAKFRIELDHVLSMILEHPDLYQKIGRIVAAEVHVDVAACRRAFLRRFPFVVVYRVTTRELTVLAVMPSMRDPLALVARMTGTT